MAFTSECYPAEPLSCPASNLLVPSSPIHADGILIKNYADHDRERNNAGMAVGWLYRNDKEYLRGADRVVVVAALVESRFNFIELESPPVAANDRQQVEFFALGGSPTMKYLKLYLAKNGDPACATYQAWLDADHTGFNRKMMDEQLRSRPGECLAAIPESTPTARYAYLIEDVSGDKQTGGYTYREPPAEWRIVDLSGRAPVTVAALTRQAKRNGFSCPPLNVRYQFWDSVQPTVTAPVK